MSARAIKGESRKKLAVSPRRCRCCGRDPEAEPSFTDRIAIVMGDDRRDEYKGLDMKFMMMEIRFGKRRDAHFDHYCEFLVRRMVQLLYRGEQPEYIRAVEDTAVLLLRQKTERDAGSVNEEQKQSPNPPPQPRRTIQKRPAVLSGIFVT